MDIQPKTSKKDTHSKASQNDNVKDGGKKNKRGRPQGARTTSLAEVRKQAAEDRKKLQSELGGKIQALQDELQLLKHQYDQETGRLTDELEALKRREGNYQQALGERLDEVAEHLQNTLLNWGAAELEEAQVDKRGRGRPRKTLK